VSSNEIGLDWIGLKRRQINVRQFTFKFGCNNSLLQTVETTHISTKNRLQTTGYGRMEVSTVRLRRDVTAKSLHII